MNRLPACLFCFLLLLFTGGTPDKRPKSLALKNSEAPQTTYGFKMDNSAARYWDEFMLVRNANAGDPLAQHELGLRYLTNDGFPADTVKAAYWIQKAALGKLAPARYNYGLLLNNGWGVPWNPFEAYRQFHAAALDGMKEAAYVTGLLLTDNLTVPRSYREAYRWETIAADSGYEPAREVLREFKRRGIDARILSSKRDSASHKGRKQGTHISSAPRSGSALQPIFIDTEIDSMRVPDDTTLTREVLTEAGVQLRKIGAGTDAAAGAQADSAAADSGMVRRVFDAAEGGSPEALTLIGRWYEEGGVMKKDEVLASVYYLRAMRLDAPWAPALLWKMSQQEEFIRRLKAGADRKTPAAEFAWSELIAADLDHQITQPQALGLLEHAAGSNYVPAIVQLGICYYTGTWVPADRQKALELLHRAARLGSREAEVRIAVLELQETKDPGKDSSRVKLLRRAAGEGSVLAQTMLGYCYATGLGVERSTPEAVQLYRSAAQRGSNAAYSALKELYAAIRPSDPEFEIDE
jgi:TPR repeat protein